MTDSTHDDTTNDGQDARDDLDSDWAAALSEQQAGGTANQAQGLDTDSNDDPADDWAAALAEQTAAASSARTDTGFSTPATEARPAPDLFKPLTSDAVDSQGDIDMIMDIPVQMSVELGRTRLTIKNVLQLGQGSVVELDGLAGEPMDIYVNGYLIAQGEVVVVEEKYGIRITDIITPSDRINRLNNRR